MPGFSRMWNGCNCDMFRFKSQLAAKKMYNSRQIIWPFPVILLFPWARSWYCLIKCTKNINILRPFWGQLLIPIVAKSCHNLLKLPKVANSCQKLPQSVEELMESWQNVQGCPFRLLTKCFPDKTSNMNPSWQNVQGCQAILTKCHPDKMSSWQNVCWPNFSPISWKSRGERNMKISFSQLREKNLSYFSSRISRDRDSCKCLSNPCSKINVTNYACNYVYNY